MYCKGWVGVNSFKKYEHWDEIFKLCLILN